MADQWINAAAEEIAKKAWPNMIADQIAAIIRRHRDAAERETMRRMSEESLRAARSARADMKDKVQDSLESGL